MTTQEEVVVGETQRFECQVIGFPTPSISWFKDEVDITYNPRYHIEFHQDIGVITLMIKHVNLADEGCYVCRAENSEGIATTTAYLVVRVDRRRGGNSDFTPMTIEKLSEEELSQVEIIKSGRSTVIEEVITRIEETEREVIEEKSVAPKITYDPHLKDQLGFREGATVYLEVSYTGYPQPHVAWYHNEQEVQDSASLTTEDLDNWTYIKVKSTTSRDSGIYKVVAQNVAGTDQAEFKIVIKSPPSSPRNLRVVEVYKDYIVIAWDEPEENGGDSIIGYQVEKTLSGDKFVQAGHADADMTKYKVTKLFEGTDYIFRVSAENRIGLSSPVVLDKPVKARLPYDPPSCPRSFRATETNKDHITLAWEAPENNGGSEIIQYVIEKKDATRASGLWMVAGTVDADEYSYRVTKLFQGNQYLFRVLAENRVGTGDAAELSEPVTAKLPYDKPLPPRNIRALETNRDYIVIGWDAPESDGGAAITNYVVEKRDSKHPGYIYIADVDANTFQYKAQRLFEGYEYYFQVFAENQVGSSEPCEIAKPVKAKLPFDEPESPNNLRVKEYWTDFITVTWDAPQGDGGSPITGYIIEKRDVSRQNWVKAGTVLPDVNTYTISNLFEGAEYLFRVFAENKVGPSKQAAELDHPCKAKMPFDPPFAPKSLKVVDYNVDYITLSWELPEHDGGASIRGYVIEKHDTHMPMWMQVTTLDRDTFTFKVENLFEGQSYDFRVAAENECGRGKYIETDRPTQARLPYDKPSIPRGLRVSDVWKDYMTLTWEAPESDGGSSLTGYTIEQRDAYEAVFRFVASLGPDVTTHQVTNLQEGHDYYYRVYSQNAAGLSERPAEIKPPVKARLPFDKPSPPRNLQVTSRGSGSISIQWDSPESDGGSPISKYHIETMRTTGNSFNRVASIDGATSAYDITGLVDGGDYYVRIFAENSAGLSKSPVEIDDPIKASKPIYKPGTPRNLRVTDTNKSWIGIEWEAPENNGGSDITNYIIECRSDMDLGYITLAKVEGHTYKFVAKNLLEGTDYNFRIKARNAAGVGDDGVELSKPVTAKLPFDPPAIPRNLRVTRADRFEMDLAWDAPEFDGGSRINGYTVEMRSIMDNKYKGLRNIDGTATIYTAVGLSEGTEYYFRIRAKNEAGIGEPLELSQPVATKAPYNVPSEPKSIEAVSVDKESVTVEWQPPEYDGGSPIKGYVVEMRSAKETKYKVAGHVNADTLQYTVKDLKEGIKYTLRVRSENAAGLSEGAAKLEKPVKCEAKIEVKEEKKDKLQDQTSKDKELIEETTEDEKKQKPKAKKPKDEKTDEAKKEKPKAKEPEEVKEEKKEKLQDRTSKDKELIEETIEDEKKQKPKAKKPKDEKTDEAKKEKPKAKEPEEDETAQKPKAKELVEEKTQDEKEKPKKKEPSKETVEETDKPKANEPEPDESKPQVTETNGHEASESVGQPPSAPKSVKVDSLSHDQMTISWEAATDNGGAPIKQYIVVIRESSKKKFKKVGKVGGDMLSYDITTGLEENKEYFVRVYAENELGISEEAAELDSPVKIPSGISKDAKVNGEVAESETTVETAAEAKTAPKPEEIPVDELITVDKQEPQTAAAATKHSQKSIPSAPRNLKATDLKVNAVTLTWEMPEDIGNSAITSYLVVMRESDKNKFKKVGQSDGQTLSLTVTKVKEGHEYFFRAYAENEVGISEDMAELENVKIPSAAQVEEDLLVLDETPKESKPVDETDAKTVNKAPEITIKPEPQSVKEGETIRLSCQISGNPEPDIDWYKDDKKMKAKKGKITVEYDSVKEMTILTIKDATADDTGIYTIKASNTAGSDTHNVSVTVQNIVTQSVETSDPELIETGSEYVDTEVTTTEMETETQDTADTEEETVSEEKRKKTLKKKVMVEVTNKVDASLTKTKKKTKKSKKDVEVVEDSMDEVDEETESAVKSSEKSKPKRGKQQEPKEKSTDVPKQAVVEELEPGDTGKVEDIPKPHFELSPQPVEVTEGESIKLSCKVAGDPKPEVTWYKGKKILKQKLDRRINIHWDVATDLYTLEIKECTIEDSDDYTVKATNEHGEVSMTVTVTVIVKSKDQDEPDIITLSYSDETSEGLDSKSEVAIIQEDAARALKITADDDLNITIDIAKSDDLVKDMKQDESATKPQLIIMKSSKDETDVAEVETIEKSSSAIITETADDVDTEERKEVLVEEVIYSPLDVDDEAFGEIVVKEVVKDENFQLPDIDLYPEPCIVPAGGTITLGTRFLGHPKPEIVWSKGKTEFLESADRVKLDFDAYQDVHLLIISDACADDAGVYVVKATNEGGSVAASVNIAVSVPEEVQSESIESESVEPTEAAKPVQTTKDEPKEEKIDTKEEPIVIDEEPTKQEEHAPLEHKPKDEKKKEEKPQEAKKGEEEKPKEEKKKKKDKKEEPKPEEKTEEQKPNEKPKEKKDRNEEPKEVEEKIETDEEPKVEEKPKEKKKKEKKEEKAKEVPKVVEPKAEEPKVEEPKVEEPKVEEPKVEEPKAEEPKADEPKAEEPKVEEPKVEEPKAREPKTKKPKAEEPKAEEPKVVELQTEEPKAEEPKAKEPKAKKPKTEEPKAEEPKAEEPKAEEPKAEEPKVEEPKAEEPKAEDLKAEEVKVEESKPEEKKEKPKKEKPKGPKFTKVPEAVNVTEGETIKLTCQVEEDAEVTWSKDGTKIKPKKKGEKKYKVDWNMKDDVYFLEISDATCEDSGEYTISAKTSKGTTIVKCIVTVEKKKIKPEIKGKLKPLTLEIGEEIKLSCKISGTPEPEVAWSKNKEVIQAKDARYKTTYKDGSCSLKVKESVVEDSAEYTVTATNAAGTVTETVTVAVKPKPEPKLKPPEFVARPDAVSVTECTELIIMVTVKGSDKLSVTWYASGKPVKASDRIHITKDRDNYLLSIPKCLLTDAGEYTCTAKDAGGEAFCSVNVTVDKSEEEEAHRELMQQLSPQIQEEQNRIKEGDMDMLFKEYPMLGPYTDSDKKVHFNEGDIVEVLDTEEKTKWLVRKQSQKDKVCYVPVELLLGKDEEEEKAEDEESSTEEEEVTEVKQLPKYTAIADYNPAPDNKDHLSLKEGEVVEVVDSSSTDRYWCRRLSKPSEEGWVPPGYLVAQTGDKLDSRSTQEVFREDVIKVTNKEQEAILKRRYALKAMWESERLYVDDLSFCLDTYYKRFNDSDVPDELKDKRDTIFSVLPDIKDFHYNKFLDELMMTTNEADSIANAFLKHRDLFQLYVPYFTERNVADYLLSLDDSLKFIKDHDRKIKNVGEKKISLVGYLKRPWTRIDEYIVLLKDFIKYTSHAKQDYSKLEEAIQMLLELKKQADDQLTLGRIEGYPDNIAALGPILRHDDFTVWDGEPVGKGRDRHLFLFKDNLMMTKKKKSDKPGDLPTYEFKGLVDLPKTLLNEEMDDAKRFQLWNEEPTRGHFTFQAKTVPIKITWCDLLRRWLRKWGKKPTITTTMDKITVKEGESAVFSSRIEGQPMPDVSWYYNDKPIKSGPQYRIVSDLFDNSLTIQQTTPDNSGRYSLTIQQTTPGNSGRYSLKANNKLGELEISADLEVKEIINKPEFQSDIADAEVLLGADARFDVKVKGKPLPEVKWYQNGKELTLGDRYKFLYPDDESFTLLIYKVEESDIGNYECCAGNKGGTVSKSAKLVITDLDERKKECAAEFTSGLADATAVEGIQTKLICRTKGYPMPEVAWYFNDREIRRGDYYDYYFDGTECMLIIRIVHEEHSGKYTCKIKNKFGEEETSANLTVATRPKFTDRFSNLEVFRNEKVEFKVKYQGFPKPDVTWSFEKHVLRDSERIKITETDTESVLTIDIAMAMDEGEYSCKISNQAGEANCSAVLFVQKDIQTKDYEVSYAPTLVKKLSNQEAIIGSPAKLICKALGEPTPTAIWFKDDKEIEETDRITIVQEENIFRLIFRKIVAADAGQYKCIINNKSGDVTTSCQILTEEPQEPIKEEVEFKVELKDLPPTMSVHKPDLTEIDFETIKLSWQEALLPKNAKKTIVKYAIDRKDISSMSTDWEAIESGIEDLSFQLKTFNPEIDYLFRIRATNEYGSSEPSMAVSYYGKTKSDIRQKRRESFDAGPALEIKKEPLPPKGPRDKPIVTEVDDDSLEVTWQPGELAPHAIPTEILYVLERRNPPSKTWLEIATDLKVTNFIMKNYKPEKDYMFRVRATNDYGISDPSLTATHFARPDVIRQDLKKQNAESDKAKPQKKEQDLRSKVKPRTIWDKPEISDLSEKSLTLRWKASGVPSYAIPSPIWYIVEQREPPNLEWVKIADDVKDTELLNVRINRRKDYYWRVKAINEFGFSEPSMPVMLRKKEEIEEVKEDPSKLRRRSRSYSREPTDRGIPEHLRIVPEFLSTPDDSQYGVEGRTMRIYTTIRAYPKPLATWYLYGRKLDMGDRHTSSLTDKGELTLEVEKFSWSDVGEYKIEVTNDFGTASQLIKVDMADPPTFLEPLHNQVFHLRSNGRLECRVHGIPYPTVTFKKDWRVIADSHRIKILREEYDHWTLTIRNAIHLDEGLFECVAENVAGKVYCSANVKVSEKHGIYRDVKFNPCPIEDYFHVIDEIGRGSYGVVRRVIDKNSGNQYAAKILRYSDPVIKEELMTELEILALLDHQNIIQIVDGYEDKKRLIMVMEIVTGGELLQRLIKDDSLTESEIAFYLRQLLVAVEYIHSKNVIHLDLRPENLFMLSNSSEDLKIIDFSFARKYNPTRRLHVKYGNPEYVSPEVVCEEPVTPAADLWSVGVIAYVLLSGISPFRRDNIRNTLLSVRSGDWQFDDEAFSNISKEARDFVSQLLVKDPKKRLTASEAIEHPFVNLSHHRGLGDRINTDKHKSYMFRRKWERGTNLVMTIVKPTPLSSYLVEQPPPEIEIGGEDMSFDIQVPMLDLPSMDGSLPTGQGQNVQMGAAGMLSLMGPASMVSAAPSTVGSGGSSEWGREYEDEDTWYEFSSAYQSGADTHLMPTKDTRMAVRMTGYMRKLGDTEQAPKQSGFRPRARPGMKERLDLRDLEKEREQGEDVDSQHVMHTRRGLWQVRRMMEVDKASEGFPPIFKEKIKDKAYNVGDSCTLRVHVIGNPPPIVSWYRNEEILSTGGRVRVGANQEDGHHSLTVLQTKPNDFGVYKCMARNKYGTVTCRARMLCGDHATRPGRPHVTKVSDCEAFMIWEEPESDGNSNIQAYKVDWFKPGDNRWTTATYSIDECALIKGLKPDTSYRFRVSAINAFGLSPYSWASIDIRTKKKGAAVIEIEEETKRILLRSRQATNRPSPESSPMSSPTGSMTDLTEETLDRKAKDHGLLDREILIQEIDPERFLSFGSDIWRGRFTLVKNVKPKEGKKVRRVAKILCYDESKAEDSLREYEMLKGVRQQHIVRLHEAFLHNDFVFLIFEKLYGENVARSLSLKNKYNEHHVSSIIKQVLDALQFLHHRGIVHLNLQPDNVIMVSRRRFDVKIVDFGRARKITTFEGSVVPREGTAEFMAPEKVAKEAVGVAADIWGVGLLAFILLSGVSPFEGDMDEDTYVNITHVRYDPHVLYHNVTKYALKFIYQILKRNPKARLTTEEALDHRWLMLNAPMVKVRKAAVFPTDKLRLFEEGYIKRRLAGSELPSRLTKAYGIGISFSSDEEGDDIFGSSSRY